MKTLSITVLGLMLAVTPALANDTPPPTFQVALDVRARDEDTRERVTTYLQNELRGLGDVEVAADNPDFKLFVVLTEMRTDRGTLMAHVLAISVTRFFPDGYFGTILSDKLTNAAVVSQRLEEVPVFERQFVSLSGPSEADLIETVTSSIRNLNTHVLEPDRQGN
jgi:hypothetical protein